MDIVPAGINVAKISYWIRSASLLRTKGCNILTGQNLIFRTKTFS